MIRCLRILLLFLVECLNSCLLTSSYEVHLSPAWYPVKKNALLKALSNYNVQASQLYDAQLQSLKIRALIVPHAGYEYSGVVASAAYRLIVPDFFKRVIILGPSHYEHFKGVGLPNKNYEEYKNVLGKIKLDNQLLNLLAKSSDLCSYQERAHKMDHCINVQLPFIQHYCGKQCTLVPLLIGEVDTQQVEKIARLLQPYIDHTTLVIVSSDFTHYGKRFEYEPFKVQQNITQQIYELDSMIIQNIQKGDLQGFNTLLHDTSATVCGRNPLKILLALEQQKTFGSIATYVVGYDTSASSEKNPEHSVSYASCVVSNELPEMIPVDHRLTGYEKKVLLTLARDRLHSVVQDAKAEKRRIEVPGLITKTLHELQGAFVTLYKIGADGYKQLRGCIGTIIATTPLYQTVYDMTESSALHDHRFLPVTKEELPYIDISISAITIPEKICSYHDIKLGRDGVIVKKNGKSAVYLPKVAVEQHWNLEELLQSLHEKAGLPMAQWKDDDAQYQIFQSIDFSEGKDPLEFMYEGYRQ